MLSLPQWNSSHLICCAKKERLFTIKHTTLKKNCLSSFSKTTHCLTIQSLKHWGSYSFSWISDMWSINMMWLHLPTMMWISDLSHHISEIELSRNMWQSKHVSLMHLKMLFSFLFILKCIRNITSHWNCFKHWIWFMRQVSISCEFWFSLLIALSQKARF